MNRNIVLSWLKYATIAEKFSFGGAVAFLVAIGWGIWMAIGPAIAILMLLLAGALGLTVRLLPAKDKGI